MNERIRELIQKADRKCSETRGVYDEILAELIVAECIQVGGPEDSYTDEWFKAKADSVNKIRKHFGVEV